MSKANQTTTQHRGLSRREMMAIAIIISGAFIAILNQTVLSPALPKLMASFQITAGTAQWVTTIYMLVNGIMVPVTAYLIDRFSTRKLFITSMLIFIVGTALTACAPTFLTLICGRVLQAMGAGIQLPLVGYVPMLLFPREKRGMAMGMSERHFSGQCWRSQASPFGCPVSGTVDLCLWRTALRLFQRQQFGLGQCNGECASHRWGSGADLLHPAAVHPRGTVA